MEIDLLKQYCKADITIDLFVATSILLLNFLMKYDIIYLIANKILYKNVFDIYIITIDCYVHLRTSPHISAHFHTLPHMCIKKYRNVRNTIVMEPICVSQQFYALHIHMLFLGCFFFIFYGKKFVWIWKYSERRWQINVPSLRN